MAQRSVTNRIPGVVAVGAQPRQRRIMRRPVHHFNLQTRPYGIYPFMIAPVLPGETMENLLLQARVVTDPVISRLTGWWKEYYFFYVKHRDLDDSASFQSMVLDAEYDISGLYEAADVLHYHHANGINWSKKCLKRVTEEFFRNQGETWNNVTIDTNIPAAGFDNLRWLDSLTPDSAMDPADDPEITVGVDDKIRASEIEQAMRSWDFYRRYYLSEMTYEDFLASYGVRVASVEQNKPELIRYVRDWKYPISAIDPADGSAANAVTWNVAERADKNRFFKEPGFLFGVTIARPKLYFGLQNAGAVSSMHDALSWLPAVASQFTEGLRSSMKKITTGANGPLSSWTGDYWIDFRDLLLYGDQFVNWSMVADASGQSVAMPTAAGNKEYPTAAMVDALFSDAVNADKIREDGVCNLNILGTQVDVT